MSEPIGIAAQVEAFRTRKQTPVDVLEAQLARIRAYNPPINAFTLVDEARAREAAAASAARWRRGEPIGQLDGVTFTVKDNLMVAGYPFRRGSRATPTTAATESAPIVARCLEAGAVMVGLNTMPEFGVGPVTISPLSGVTTNPWDTRMQAGGSSGGGTAAVAAGFCTFSLGSDAGGSIRIPAALCGVVGLKPTGGRVPMYPSSPAGALSCHGPITHTVEDAALLLTLATRPDARDPMAIPASDYHYLPGLADGVRGMKIALSLTLGYARKVHPEIAAATRRAAAVLERLGAIVEERDPGIADPTAPYLMLFETGIRYALRGLKPEQIELLSPTIREILAKPATPINEYLQAQEHCQQLARRLQAFHDEFDLLVTPTVAAPAFAADRHCPEDYDSFGNIRAWVPYTALFNLTHQPAISVPAGLTQSGLPIGFHIVGPRGADARVLRAAHAYAAASPFTARPTLGSSA